MKRMKVLSVMLALLTMGFVACQKEDMNEPGPAFMGVKMVALNTSYSLPVEKSSTKSAVASPGIAWDEVRMVVSEVELEAELKSLLTHEDSIEIEYKWKGPQVVNLLDSTQTFGNFILQPGFYDEIELKVGGEREDARPEPVFYMSGNYTNAAAGETIPVVVEVYSDLEFKTEKESVEVTEDNLDITSTIQLYLDELMAGISPEQLDNAALSEGVIVISEDSNSQLFQSVLGKLAEERDCRYWHKNKYDDDDDDYYDDDDDDD